MYINIIGYGITNKAIVTMLNQKKIMCHIYDDKYECDSRDEMGNTFYSLRKLEILHDANPNGDLNLTIISPGIPPNTPFLHYFHNIISEYDFIFQMVKGLYSIWVSGTNGKTTTTEMLACMLEAKSGGNIGVPLATLFMQDFYEESCEYFFEDSKPNCRKNLPNIINVGQVYNVCTLQDSKATWVLETSSFTLHYTNYALPNIYVLLPLSQDHISWHGSFESYVLDKLKPLKLMNYASNPKQHHALIPKELTRYKAAQEIIKTSKANIFLYEDSNELYRYLQCDKKYFEFFKEPFKLDFLLSASCMAFGGIPFYMENILKYKIGEYRMQEYVHNGLLFVNDSKATNPHAVLSALNSYKNYVIYLILGGDSKGAEMDMLYPFLQTHAIKVFSIGKDGKSIANACRANNIWVKECIILDNAMRDIRTQLHRDYDVALDSMLDFNNRIAPVVMLSPACASLDQYESYKMRGEKFNELIKLVF